ncbi:plasmid replication protein RepC [Antarctobacter sp.]|uniref:plasmid replication protein RepC n=1 Tax=Antarctobacter sp. TaxID=1872577 RepID=UPI003A8DCF75
MGYAPIAPFRRSLDAVLLDHHRRAAQDGPVSVDKWQALRLLSAARARFGLTHQALAVLQALLSFHPETELSADRPAVVHPANATICDRLNGMPCSTMRRHLARLVDAGVLLRRDSPNGKRYARRVAGHKVAYGFDLAPLRTRFAEIEDAAETARTEAAQIRQKRDCVKLMRRDLEALVSYARGSGHTKPQWDALDDLARLTARALRRKLSHDDLCAIERDLSSALTQAGAWLDVATPEMSTTDARNEQHLQKTKKDYFDSERPVEKPRPIETKFKPQGAGREADISLDQVLESCPEIVEMGQGPVKDWPSLVRSADTVRPMMGITKQVWISAKQLLGSGAAAVVLAVMLQRFAQIRNPGGYLRHLTKRAHSGGLNLRSVLGTVTASGALAGGSQV